ncbi:MAG: AAA family ATPase [bacterium]
MIERINSINNFGSFDGYKHSGDLPDFTKKNILYGWNYSGKTTISRIFDSVKRKVLHPDYSTANFNIKVSDGKVISNDNIASTNIKVEVFNSDFIRDNLHWDCDEASDGIAFDVGEDVHGYRTKKDDNNLYN